MLTIRDSDRVCQECGGSGQINMGPTLHGGPNVYERCECQPAQAETDQDYYARRARQADDEADRLIAIRETKRAATSALAAE